VDDATSTDFDRNLYHLAANNRYWPTGLVAHPGPRCDVRIASTGAAAEPPAAVCVALERYFQDRLYEALVLHSDDAFGLIAAGTKTGSPLAIALNFPGMTAQYAQRLVMAGSSVRGALQAEVNWPRSRARTVSGCVLVSTGATVCPVQHPNMENVQALLAAGDSVDERTLEMAATSGNAEVLRLLAERIQDKTRSPEVLRLAIGYGPSALVEALLQAGWSANAGLGTPERFAVNPCSGLCIPIQVALVGADAAGDALLGPPFRTANERMTYEAQAGTWMSSARRADLTRMVSALFAHGAVLKDYDPVELYDAVYYDDGAAVVKLLLDHGATARARYQYKDGLHGLLWVAHHTLYSGFDGDPQVLELLRTHGAQN
jgi:hypothetical protein